MGGSALNPNGDFNTSSGAKADLPKSDTMALIIDIQGAGNMSEKDAKAYFDKLGQTVEDLRAKNIPITWVVMGRNNNLIKPENGLPQRRDLDELSGMGFDGMNPGQKNRMIYRQFMRDHGPQTNEAVYEKFFKGAFVEPKDYADNDALRTTLENDYRKGKDGKPIVAPPDPDTKDDPAFTDYLKNERGVKNVLVLGAVSTNCVTATAISAMKKGFGATIGIDGVLSWEGDEAKVDPRTSKLRWRDGDALMAKDDFHRQKIEERLDQMTDQEKKAWGLTDADIESIKKNIMTTSEFTAAHAAQQTSAPKVTSAPAAAGPN